MRRKRTKATTLASSVNGVTGMRKTFSEVLNNWFNKAYDNEWEIKYIINHAPKESVTIIYEYEEKL
jgi:hypothetical protein